MKQFKYNLMQRKIQTKSSFLRGVEIPLFLFDKGEYPWYNVTIINGEHTKTQNKQNERKMFMKIELPDKYVEQGIDTLEKLFEYLDYLEDVKEDYVYLKGKLKSLVTEIETLLY